MYAVRDGIYELAISEMGEDREAIRQRRWWSSLRPLTVGVDRSRQVCADRKEHRPAAGPVPGGGPVSGRARQALMLFHRSFPLFRRPGLARDFTSN